MKSAGPVSANMAPVGRPTGTVDALGNVIGTWNQSELAGESFTTIRFDPLIGTWGEAFIVPQ